MLILFDRWHREKANTFQKTGQIPFSKAAGIGVFQCLSVIPGVSRSAATIVGGLSLGLNRKITVEFSFLLAAPTLLAAAALDFWKSKPTLDATEWKLLGIGGFVSFAVSILCIRFFLRFVQKRGFTVFGVYRIAAAVLFWMFVR